MKINNLTPPGQIQPSEPGKTGGKPPTAGAASAPQSSAQPKLGAAAWDTSQDIDIARVNELRQAISEGRLKVDVGRIADGLIDSVNSLLNKKSP